LCDIPSLEVLNGRKRNYYSKNLTAVQKTAFGDTEIKISSSTEVLRKEKVKKNLELKEETNVFEEMTLKRKKKRQQDTEDEFSERYSITAITGLQPAKKKHKEKSVSGVVSVSKPKTKKLKQDTDISAITGGVNFGTGQRTQWF